MRVAIVSFRKELLKENLKRLSHKIVKHRPEIVVALGGDGTFLWAEKLYPYVPKVFIYSSKTCEKCSIINVSEILEKLPTMKFKKQTKLIVEIGRKKLHALNDINLHYIPPRALRFDVSIDGKIIASDVIGDGVVVSTPFGSSAYFHSITKRKFKKGIGIAFNNSTKRLSNKIVKEDSAIEIVIKRERGVLAWDTNPKCISVKKGDIIKIRTDPKQVDVALFKK